MQSLNELSGAPYSDPGTTPRNATQVESLDHLKKAYDRVLKPPLGMSGARAFSELCRTSSRYDPQPLGTVAGERAPYDKGLVSMPPPASTLHPVVESLDGGDKFVVEHWASHILKSPQDRDLYSTSVDRPRPFLEPTLVKESSVYADFLDKLDKGGLLSWKQGLPSLLGVFFVRKKNGRLRIILDTRDVNGFFRPAPKTRLPTASALGSLEVDASDDVYLSGADLEDCFYHLGVPAGLEEWFTLPSVRAGLIAGLPALLGVGLELEPAHCTSGARR